MGNICRSPLAEAALRQQSALSGLSLIIDSAGTHDWHTGQPPDDRAQTVAAKNGAPIDHLRARPVRTADFRDFDHIIALDGDNLRNLQAMEPVDGSATLSLLLDHVEGRAGENVADPYYKDDQAFDVTWADAVAGAKALIKSLSRSQAV
ncbi:low molecular weight phosphotyrosine protein phosphatase [Parasphingorhabdus cellanae]|uniref:protein-tyrosine-phosphatase n=2 Tax=Parasphingorhabdus cellanae TaxID=2806553 RepID=A0ABX7TAI3_9SPHN|nr:low molecular weight phosphotyrosine protein phosphatase [Parasphingorhabdus cellanae]